MTIREAAIKVLSEEKRPMRCSEIAAAIKNQRLHSLQTDYPTSVVNKAVRRHCLGIETDGSRPLKYFRALPGKRYALLEPRPQMEK